MYKTRSTVKLPILTPYNAHEFPEWHMYYRRVYRHPVKCNVVLDDFSWFYRDAPLPSVKLANFTPFKLDRVPKNAFMRVVNCADDAPERFVGQTGVFRNVQMPDLSEATYVEVIRTNMGEGASETDEAWFYHAVGSGMFIETRGLEIIDDQKHLTEIIKKMPFPTQANDDIEVFTHVTHKKPRRWRAKYTNGVLDLNPHSGSL